MKNLLLWLVVSCLVAGPSAAGGELKPEQVDPLGDLPIEDEQSEPGREDAPQDKDADALAFLPTRAVPVQVDPARPELLRVPDPASREEFISRLFGETSAEGAYDFEPCEVSPDAQGEPRLCVRVHPFQALPPEWLAAVRGALDAQLEADVAWTTAQLGGTSLDRQKAAAIVERGLRWSQRSDLVEGSGGSYFDRYLEALARHRDEPPRWGLGDTRCQDWHFLGEASEPLQKVIALRSRRFKTRYTVTEGTPTLAPGSSVGRFYFADGTSTQVRLLVPLTEERSRERAELRLRNLPRRGPSVIMPGEDGRWRGYGVDFGGVAGAPEPLEHPEGRFYWYYPGTRLIRPEDGRPAMESDPGGLETLRREILQTALAAATPRVPQSLFGLEQEVLGRLTSEERKGVVATLLAGPALSAGQEEEAIQLLGRVVLSTPEREFAPLERQLTSSGVLNRLLASNAPGKVLLGRAFTQKALASFPLRLDSLETLPTFHLGREGETTHLLNVPSGQVPTMLLAPEAWGERQGIHLGAEPALPGETPGPTQRTALYFEPVRQHFQARYLSSVEKDPRSRALHPLEWVRVEEHGAQPRTHLMTALELALVASVPDTTPVWTALGRISELHMMYGAVSAWARAPVLEGVEASADRGSARVAARQAATRLMVGRLSLVAGLAGVDSWRDELSSTPRGRAFLAVHDLALLALAGRDVSKLVTSGIGRELLFQGERVLNLSGARASAGLSETVEGIQALTRTLDRMLAEFKVMSTPEGLRFTFPEDVEAFKRAFFAIRGELAAVRALGGIGRAGLATQEAEKTLAALKVLAAEGPEMGRAYGAVARHAARLPADKAQAYLAAVESLRISARAAAKPALAELLWRSGAPSLVDPLAFMKEAEWLVGHPELDAETVGSLAKKASTGRVDLDWLRSTGLSTEDLNFMARDKNMPWRLFQNAAVEPSNWMLQRQAREQLRGVAGEMLTERNAQRLFPGYRLTGRQVRLGGGHIIDYELTSLDRLRTQHGVEAKAWNEKRWRGALDAWELHLNNKTLDKEQALLVKQFQRLLDQLSDAARSPRGKPFLVTTDRLNESSKLRLVKFLEEEVPSTKLIQVEETKILEKTKQLRAAMKMPEELPGGAP